MIEFCTAIKSKSSTDFVKTAFAGKHIPLDGIVELTHRCNFRCIHCYGANERKEKDLTVEQWKSLFEQMADCGCLNLIMTGGEALCRSDFVELYTYARSLGIMVAVFSNASLVTDEHIAVFEEYPLSYFSTTMYGASRETYELVTGSADNYNHFINGVELLLQNSIPVEIKAVVLRDNADDLHKIRDYAHTMNVPFRFSTGIRASNDADDYTKAHCLTAQEEFNLEMEIPERHDFWQSVADNPLQQPYTDGRRQAHYKYLCHMGEQSFMVDASGILHCCVVNRSYGYSLLDGLFSEGWEKFIPSIACTKATDTFPCLTCEDFRYCEQCTARIELEACSALEPLENMCMLAHLRHEWCREHREGR